MMPDEDFLRAAKKHFDQSPDTTADWNASFPLSREVVYRRHIQSSKWRNEIRPRILDRDSKLCQVCHERAADHVHHRRYDEATYEGLDDDGLISVCECCHERIEARDEKGCKPSLEEKELRLISRRTWFEEKRSRLKRPVELDLHTDTCRGVKRHILIFRGGAEDLKFLSFYQLLAITCDQAKLMYQDIESGSRIKRPEIVGTLRLRGEKRLSVLFINQDSGEGIIEEKRCCCRPMLPVLGRAASILGFGIQKIGIPWNLDAPIKRQSYRSMRMEQKGLYVKNGDALSG